MLTGTDVSCQADERRWALLPFGGLRTGTDVSSRADERRLALLPFGSLLTRLTDDPVSRHIARAIDRKRSPTDLVGLESFPFSSIRRFRVAAVAGLLICAAVARLHINGRLAVAGLLTCAAVARLYDNRHLAVVGLLRVQPPPGRVTTVIVVAVAGSCQPSPGCSPLCSRREAACQPPPGRRRAVYLCSRCQAV